MERRERAVTEPGRDMRIEYSELLVGTELIEVDAFIECRIGENWHEVGHAMIIIDEDQQSAKWGDIVIGSRNGKYKILDDERVRPKDIDGRVALRGRGIGSRVVKAVLERLKGKGIHRVYGTIGPADDRAKVLHFWESLGFAVRDQSIEKLL